MMVVVVVTLVICVDPLCFQARNITCCVKFKDSDELDVPGLCVSIHTCTCVICDMHVSYMHMQALTCMLLHERAGSYMHVSELSYMHM